jgi:hypothetical protein
LDSITALGVNVKARQTLDRAEEILAQLKQLAITNAKGVYLEMASVGRWGSPSARVKQAIIDATNERLAALGVSDAERKEIVRPVIESIGPDLAAIYHELFDALLTWKYVELSRKLAGDLPNRQKAMQPFINDRDAWKRLAEESPDQESKAYDLAAHLRADTPTKMLDDKERAIAARFMSEVQSLYDGCLAKGGYTPEAAQFLDKYDSIGGAILKVKELFGVDVSGNYPIPQIQ